MFRVRRSRRGTEQRHRPFGNDRPVPTITSCSGRSGRRIGAAYLHLCCREGLSPARTADRDPARGASFSSRAPFWRIRDCVGPTRSAPLMSGHTYTLAQAAAWARNIGRRGPAGCGAGARSCRSASYGSRPQARIRSAGPARAAIPPTRPRYQAQRKHPAKLGSVVSTAHPGRPISAPPIATILSTLLTVAHHLHRPRPDNTEPHAPRERAVTPARRRADTEPRGLAVRSPAPACRRTPSGSYGRDGPYSSMRITRDSGTTPS